MMKWNCLWIFFGSLLTRITMEGALTKHNGLIRWYFQADFATISDETIKMSRTPNSRPKTTWMENSIGSF